MTDYNDEKLMQAANALATDIAPRRDLWPGVAEAIAVPARRRWSPMLAQAAAVIMLVGASSAVTYTVMKDESATVATTIATPGMVFEQASFGSRYTLGPGFQDARNSLVSELDVELQKLSTDDRANIETNLQLIHEAIFEMNEALEADPDNTLLQEQLLRTYRDELALLRRVGGLTRNVMMRNDI
ncbi:MAG: hypothetical protein K0U72_11655 [Gammaproteobacteria bacterium]|nr:hypothetical protein [Gammaproteobacteria bacterium]